MLENTSSEMLVPKFYPQNLCEKVSLDKNTMIRKLRTINEHKKLAEYQPKTLVTEFYPQNLCEKVS